MTSVLATPSTFAYEDLVERTKRIKNEITSFYKTLSVRTKSKSRDIENLKSRSFIFIDPYGNEIVNTHMDHEYISFIVKNYKEEFVPKYLQNSIQIGIFKDNKILAISDRLLTTVSKYEKETRFIAYVSINVFLSTFDGSTLEKFVFNLRLTDTMEKVENEIHRKRPWTIVGYKSRIFCDNDNPTKDDWNEASNLTRDQTILSSKLYRENTFVLAETIDKMPEIAIADGDFRIFIKTLTRKSLVLMVNSSMSIEKIKELIEAQEGILPDQQRLFVNGVALGDESTAGDNNIGPDATIYLILRLRGGMYHFTSGRQNFLCLPFEAAQIIRQVLTYTFQVDDDEHRLSSIDLQDSLLKAQNILDDLYRAVEKLSIPSSLIDLTGIICSVNRITIT